MIARKRRIFSYIHWKMWIFQISVFYGRDFWWENLKGYHRKDLLTVPRAKIKLSKLRSKCSGFNKLVLNIPWPFFEHLRSSIFLPDLNFLFSLALLNRAGMVQTFKKYGGFIKGTASEQKLFEIFFKIFNIFQPGGGWPNVSGRAFIWIFVLCPLFCGFRQRIRGTAYEWWFMKIHESGFFKGFFICSHQRLDKMVQPICVG